jgi:hypothetical protein
MAVLGNFGKGMAVFVNIGPVHHIWEITGSFPVPQGQMEIARSFNCGCAVKNRIRPEGTADIKVCQYQDELL